MNFWLDIGILFLFCNENDVLLKVSFVYLNDCIFLSYFLVVNVCVNKVYIFS